MYPERGFKGSWNPPFLLLQKWLYSFDFSNVNAGKCCCARLLYSFLQPSRHLQHRRVLPFLEPPLGKRLGTSLNNQHDLPHAFSRDFPQLHALDSILIGSLPADDITAKLTRIIANSILETSSAMISCTQHSGKQQRPKHYRRGDHGLSLFSNFSKYVLRYAIHRGWRRAIRLTSLTGRAPPKSTCGKQSKAHTDYLKNLIMETSC